MKRPFLNFRPSVELLEDVVSIGLAEGLSNADVTRQLCQKGLDEYRQGRFKLEQPSNAVRNSGGPDRRHLRQTGDKIREKKTGGKMFYVGASERQDRPDTLPALEGDVL